MTPRPLRHLGAPLALVLAVAGAALLAGCGSDSSSSAATSSTSAAATDGAGGSSGADPRQAFTACLKAQGVDLSKLPQGGNGGPPPTGTGGGGRVNGFGGAMRNDPAFQKAFAACQKQLGTSGFPGGRPGNGVAFQASAAKFAKCMRTSGVADFPDPDFSGGGQAGGQGTGPGTGPFGKYDLRTLATNAKTKKAFAACRSALGRFPGAQRGQNGAGGTGGQGGAQPADTTAAPTTT